MNRLRSRWGARWVVALLLASILPVNYVTVATSAQRTLHFSDWVRAQLRGPVDDAIAQALAQAEATDPTTLDDFLEAFVEAYESLDVETSLTDAFAAPVGSHEALVSYLQGRYSGVMGVAPLPRPVYLMMQVVSQATTSHEAALLAVLQATQSGSRLLTANGVLPDLTTTFVFALRHLTAAQPLGP